MDNVTQTTPTTGTPPGEMADLTGKTLGDFRLLRKLGQGGMGQVYLAEQVSLNRKVALKLLRPDFAANRTALERFRLEAQSVARVTHANIVQVYQVGEEQDLHFMALEYVEGRNLRDYLARKGPPEVLLALSIMRQVGAALQRASELGIIHRDIKPENILLTRKGEVKVADFGLSRVLEGDQPAVNLTQSGVTMGTPLYMSPEQVEGKALDFRTDIYSFGVTCYHMLAGEPPFKGTSAFEVALKHVREEPPPLPSIRPDLPADLCAVVHKMMAKDPAGRYQSGKELLKDLARLRESLSGQTGFVPLAGTALVEQDEKSTPSLPALSARTALLPSRKRRGLLVALFLASIIVAGTAGAVFGWMRQKGNSPPDGETAKIEPGLAPDASPLEEREKDREKRLLAEFKHHLTFDSQKGFSNAKLGAEICLEYALPLLKRPDRIKDAEDRFKELERLGNTYKGGEWCTVVGILGRGLVLAFKDKPEESNKAFLALLAKRPKVTDLDRPRPLVIEALRSHPDLPKMLREAVHRNLVNSKGSVEEPRYLKEFLNRTSPGGGSRDRTPPRKPDSPSPRG